MAPDPTIEAVLHSLPSPPFPCAWLFAGAIGRPPFDHHNHIASQCITVHHVAPGSRQPDPAFCHPPTALPPIPSTQDLLPARSDRLPLTPAPFSCAAARDIASAPPTCHSASSLDSPAPVPLRHQVRTGPRMTESPETRLATIAKGCPSSTTQELPHSLSCGVSDLPQSPEPRAQARVYFQPH